MQTEIKNLDDSISIYFILFIIIIIMIKSLIIQYLLLLIIFSFMFGSKAIIFSNLIFFIFNYTSFVGINAFLTFYTNLIILYSIFMLIFNMLCLKTELFYMSQIFINYTFVVLNIYVIFLQKRKMEQIVFDKVNCNNSQISMNSINF